MRSRTHIWQAFTVLLIIGLGGTGGCNSATAPEPLAVEIEAVSLRTEAEFRAWPFTPTISGGRTIVVRGTALAGCGTLAGTASRAGQIINVEITAPGADRPCIASLSGSPPFRATISGLRAGTYRVRAATVGHHGRAEFEVTVLDP